VLMIYGEHDPYAVIVCEHYLVGLNYTETCILNVIHPPCVSRVESLVDFIELIIQILLRDIVPNLEQIRVSSVETYLNAEQIVHCFIFTL